VEIAQAVEGEPEARAGLDQIGFTPQRLAQRAHGRRHLAPGDEGLAPIEVHLRVALGRRRRRGDSRAPGLSDAEEEEQSHDSLRQATASSGSEASRAAQTIADASVVYALRAVVPATG